MVKPLDQNQFYGLKSKRKLKKMIFFDNDNYLQQYKVYCTNQGKRLVEEPFDCTLKLHKRIYKFISNIETPDYLFSSTKGKSHIDNAKFHKNYGYVVTLDLSKFFPKCSFSYVRKFFLNKLKMSSVNANLLAQILTIDISQICLNENVKEWYANAEKKLKYPIPINHVPTGSCISQKLAFLAYLDMFDEINKLCLKKKIRMSVYVDDIVLSSNRRISKTTIKSIIYIFSKYGHEVNKSKIRFYSTNRPKKITGIYIDKNNQLKAPSRQHYDVIELQKQINNGKIDNVKLLNTILGKMKYINNLEGKKFHQLIKYDKKILENIKKEKSK